MSKAVRELQLLLIESGEELPRYGADGVIGRETREAIDRTNFPKWIKTAMKEVGVHEIHGIKNNNQVLKYHAVSGGFSTDEIPWCGSFVNWVMLQTGYKTVPFPARAKNWLKYGRLIDKPVVGAIAIKSRKGGGHVCFVVGRDSRTGKLLCLGGNQNDQVNIELKPDSVFLGFRLPMGCESYKLLTYDFSGSLSEKES